MTPRETRRPGKARAGSPVLGESSPAEQLSSPPQAKEQGHRRQTIFDTIDDDTGEMPPTAPTDRRMSFLVEEYSPVHLTNWILRSGSVRKIVRWSKAITNTVERNEGKSAYLDNIYLTDFRTARKLVKLVTQASQNEAGILELISHDDKLAIDSVNEVLTAWRHWGRKNLDQIWPTDETGSGTVREISAYRHLPEGSDFQLVDEDEEDDLLDFETGLVRETTSPVQTKSHKLTRTVSIPSKKVTVVQPDDPGDSDSSSSDDLGNRDNDRHRRREKENRKARGKQDRRRRLPDESESESDDASLSLGTRSTLGLTGELTTDVARVTSSRLKRDPIGSFDPDQRDPGKRGIVTPAGKPPIYTDVFLFTLRVKEWMHVEDPYVLTYHYMTLLGGGALQWLQIELDPSERARLMRGSDKTFRKALEARFAPPKAEYTSVTYTTDDWIDDKPIAQFIQRKVSLARQLGIRENGVVISHIWGQIDPQILLATQTRPDKYSTVSEIIKIFRESRQQIDMMVNGGFSRRRRRQDDRSGGGRRSSEGYDTDRSRDSSRNSAQHSGDDEDRNRRYNDRRRGGRRNGLFDGRREPGGSHYNTDRYSDRRRDDRQDFRRSDRPDRDGRNDRSNQYEGNAGTGSFQRDERDRPKKVEFK